MSTAFSSTTGSTCAPAGPDAHAPPRECPGGRARPAADGRAGPFRFRKELVRSSRNGTRSEGPSDSGRTLFFPGRNGPARPSAAGRSRPPGHSRPFVSGRLSLEELRAISGTQMHIVFVSRIYTVAPFIAQAFRDPSAFFHRGVRGLCASHLIVTHRRSSCSREAILTCNSNILVSTTFTTRKSKD